VPKLSHNVGGGDSDTPGGCDQAQTGEIIGQ